MGLESARLAGSIQKPGSASWGVPTAQDLLEHYMFCDSLLDMVRWHLRFLICAPCRLCPRDMETQVAPRRPPRPASRRGVDEGGVRESGVERSYLASAPQTGHPRSATSIDEQPFGSSVETGRRRAVHCELRCRGVVRSRWYEFEVGLRLGAVAYLKAHFACVCGGGVPPQRDI